MIYSELKKRHFTLTNVSTSNTDANTPEPVTVRTTIHGDGDGAVDVAPAAVLAQAHFGEGLADAEDGLQMADLEQNKERLEKELVGKYSFTCVTYSDRIRPRGERLAAHVREQARDLVLVDLV